MRKLASIMALLSCSFATPVAASSTKVTTAASLVLMCNVKESDANYWYKIGMCDGYLSGVISAYERQRASMGLKECIGDNIAAHAIVVSILPEVDQGMPADAAVVRALHLAISKCS